MSNLHQRIYIPTVYSNR